MSEGDGDGCVPVILVSYSVIGDHHVHQTDQETFICPYAF